MASGSLWSSKAYQIVILDLASTISIHDPLLRVRLPMFRGCRRENSHQVTPTPKLHVQDRIFRSLMNITTPQRRDLLVPLRLSSRRRPPEQKPMRLPTDTGLAQCLSRYNIPQLTMDQGIEPLKGRSARRRTVSTTNFRVFGCSCGSVSAADLPVGSGSQLR